MTTTVKPRRPPLFTSGLGYLVRSLNKSISRALAAELAEHGVGLKHYYYLRALFEEDGISQIELSRRVGIESATATRVLSTMERDGYIRRARDKRDARVVNVLLTPRAKRLQEPLRELLERVNRRFIGDLSARDYAAFRTTVLTMLDNVGDAL